MLNKLRLAAADLIMWIVQPVLGQLLGDITRRQDQIIRRLFAVEDVTINKPKRKRRSKAQIEADAIEAEQV